MDVVCPAATTVIAASTGPAQGTNTRPSMAPKPTAEASRRGWTRPRRANGRLEHPSDRRHEQPQPCDDERHDAEGAQQPGRKVQLGDQPGRQQRDRCERADQAGHHQVGTTPSRDGGVGAVTRQDGCGQHPGQDGQHAGRQPRHEARDESDCYEHQHPPTIRRTGARGRRRFLRPHYERATTHRSATSERVTAILGEHLAGVAQWQSPSLPSWPCRFDPGHPLDESVGAPAPPLRLRPPDGCGGPQS